MRCQHLGSEDSYFYFVLLISCFFLMLQEYKDPESAHIAEQGWRLMVAASGEWGQQQRARTVGLNRWPEPLAWL